MIVVTGGAGFIGSAFVWKCNLEGLTDILIVDNLGKTDKWKNLVGLKFADYMHKDEFLELLLGDMLPEKIEAIVHMGACSSTTEDDTDYLMENNYKYTQFLANWAVQNKVRFIYASSAATYGDGAHGFLDTHKSISFLRPINKYGYSKQIFDLYASRNNLLDKIVGLKFFNVFGPNEHHKGVMKSVICKAFNQINKEGTLKLFKSYKPEYEDGGQVRDFIYVKDCVEVIWWVLNNKEVNGIFNVGTGIARSWNDLAKAIFHAMGKPVDLEYVEMPEDIKSHYQYYTQAGMDKLREAGCVCHFSSLEVAVDDYINSYLVPQKYLC
jgi:ADP-L-glycero-D-manno-heptose 6-epimerase